MRLDTVFLLPGLDGTGKLFAGFTAVLPPTLRVVIAQYPTDHFLTYSDLVTLVSQMLPTSGSVVLIAESFSTPLAAKLVANQSDQIAGLVMCAGFVTSPLRGSTALIRALVGPWLFRHLPPSSVLKYFLLGSDAPAPLEEAVEQTLRLVSPQVLSERVRAVLDCDARKDLARVRVPMMYIRAERDRLVRGQCFREIRDLRPDASFVSVRAPHLVLQKEPQRSAELIMRFIHQISRSS